MPEMLPHAMLLTYSEPAIVKLAGKICVTPLEEIPALPEPPDEYIQKLVQKGHESVIEHVVFTTLITCSRACSHQIVRHRLASYSQQSQRYTAARGEYILPPSVVANPEALAKFKKVMETCQQAYEELVTLGIPREDARYVLPNASVTNLLMTMNARELRHFLKLRLDKNAQWEIREISRQILEQVMKVTPYLFQDIAEEYERGGENDSEK